MTNLLRMGWVSMFGVSMMAFADTVYEVGAGRTYTTIASAMAAVPKGIALTENHIVNVHADTPGGTLIVNSGVYLVQIPENILATKTARIVLQAEPGDDVIVTNSWSGGRVMVKSDNATIRGIKFTGVGYAHVAPGHGFTVGGLLVYNCEFEHSSAVRKDTDDGGNLHRNLNVVDYTCCFINNRINNAINATGNSSFTMMDMDVIAGNLVIDGKVCHPAAIATNAYVINNTYIRPWTAMQYGGGITNYAGMTIANNITVGATDEGFCRVNAPDIMVSSANMHNNLCDASNNRWATYTLSTGGKWALATLASFNTMMATYGKAGESNGLDDTNPMFKDAGNGDYRLAVGSAAGTTGVASDSTGMVAAFNLGQAGAMGAYWNPARGTGFARGGSQRGAMKALSPPAGTLMFVR
jgi:hypothetical protein